MKSWVVAVSAVAIAVIAAGCGQPRASGGASGTVAIRGQLSTIPRSGDPPPGAISAAARARAVAQAERMLAGVRVPPGSRLVDAFPGRQLTAPAVEPLCSTIEDDTLRWIVPRSPAVVAAFLTSHVPATMTASGSGQDTSAGTVTSYFRTYRPRGHSSSTNQLVFTWAPDGSGGTSLRADGLTVLASGATCVNPGGPMVPAKSRQHRSLLAGSSR
jgi:hypothetical protein